MPVEIWQRREHDRGGGRSARMQCRMGDAPDVDDYGERERERESINGSGERRGQKMLQVKQSKTRTAPFSPADSSMYVNTSVRGLSVCTICLCTECTHFEQGDGERKSKEREQKETP